MKRTIKIVVTDEDGVVLDNAEFEVGKEVNSVAVLAHDSMEQPTVPRHWVADLNIGKGK